MGFYKDIDADIRSMVHAGYSLTNIYIYYKDYLTMEDVVRIVEEEQVQ